MGRKWGVITRSKMKTRLSTDWNKPSDKEQDCQVNMLTTLQFSKLFLVAPQVTFPSLLMEYATQRNMRLNEKKCKEMVITFLKYQPSPVPPMFLNGAAIVRVSSFKLLGVTLSNDLSWNDHCDEMLNKACKRLYALRSLKAAGLNQKDLLLVYCALVRSVVEYASPVCMGGASDLPPGYAWSCAEKGPLYYIW